MNKGLTNNADPQDRNRRWFLKGIIIVLNIILAFVVAIPGLGYLLTPVLRRRQSNWVKLGRLSDVSSKIFAKAIFHYISSSGYASEEKKAFAWVRQGSDGQIVALSPVCTHMGCNVSWNKAHSRFECPCHGGMYDENGNVIAGPPPRPLYHFPVKIENEIVYLQRNES